MTRKSQVLRGWLNGLFAMSSLIMEGGFRDLVGKFFEKVPRGVLHFDIIYVAQLDEPIHVKRRWQEFVVRKARRKDIPRLVEVFGSDPAALHERFSEAHTGFLCERDGTLAGMVWLDLGDKHLEPEKFCSFVVPPYAAWGYNLVILPEWQLTGAFLSLVSETVEHARRHGRRRMFGWASWHNRASLNAHVSLGYTVVQTVTILNLLGLRVHRTRPVKPSIRPKTQIRLLSWPEIELFDRDDNTTTDASREARKPE